MDSADSQRLPPDLVLSDPAGQERLFRACREELRNQLPDSTRQHVSADLSDLIQETLLEAARDLPQFRGKSRDDFMRWLTGILRHNANDRLKYEQRRKRIPPQRQRRAGDSNTRDLFAMIPSDASSPSVTAMRDERHRELAAAIDHLPEDQAIAVRLRHLDGLSLEQISSRMKRSRPAIAGLLTRAISTLRRMPRLQEP